MADNAKWYVAHTYSGYENTVAASIEKAVENRGLRDLIQEVSIPLETVTEMTDNGPKTVERKVFPGYVLVKMVMTDDTWHLVRNIRGATGFVGSGNKAIPLTDEEIAALGVATTSKSPTVLWSPSWARSRRSTWTAARSGWWSPCSAAKPPSSLSWTR